MKLLVATLAIGLSAVPALAEERTDAARAFLMACAEALPDTDGSVLARRDDGWRDETSDGGYQFFSRFNRKVIVGTTFDSASKQGCLAAVSRMSDDSALAMARSVAGELGLTPGSEPPPGMLGIWFGSLNGRAAALVAVPAADFGFMRGASLVLSEV